MNPARIVRMIFFFTLTASAALTAQPRLQLSADFQQTPLKEALHYLELNYPVSFSFDDDLLENITVEIHFREASLQTAMEKLLSGTGLEFEILDNRYVIIKKREKTSRETDQPPPPPSYTICGKILDNETGEALPGATAYVKNTPHGITSDPSGDFSLKGHFRNDDTLVVSFLGYEQLQLSVRTFLDQPCNEFRLGFSSQWIPELTVTEFTTDMVQVGEKGNFQFKKQKIPTMPGWGEPDVMRMLQLLPGIGSVDESAARLNVRGGTPDQNLVLWEGIPIYHTGHFFGLYDAFNPYIVDEVEVWRGNFSAAYGGRNSSVIDIKGKPGYVDEKTWGIGFNLLSIQAFLEKPLFQKRKDIRKNKEKKGAMMIALRKSWVDLVNSRTYENLFDQVFQNGRIALQEQYREQNEFVTWDPLINYSDFNFKIRWSSKKNRDNRFTIFSTNDRLDYLFSFDNNVNSLFTKDKMEASNFGLSWQQDAEWSPSFRIRYKVASSAYSNKYSFEWMESGDQEINRLYRTDNIMGDLSAQFHHTWEMNNRHRMSFGYQFNAQASEFVFRDTNLITGEGNLLDSDTITNTVHTFYAEFDYDVNDNFSFSLGIRENHSPDRGLYYSEPRISFVWRTLWDGFSINGSMGRYWQFVFHIVNFTDLGVGEPLWALTSENIPAQELWQWTLGMRFENKSMLLDAELYRKDGRNLTSLNLRVDSDFNRPLSFNGRSRASGLDIMLRKRIPPYSLWISGSIASVEFQFPELNNNQYFPARHDIRRSLNLVNMVSLKNWDLAANLHLRTGSPYSIPEVVQVPCNNCQEPQYALSYNELNTARLPRTVRLDLSATYNFEKDNKKGKTGIAFYNLLDRRNILDVDFILEGIPGQAPAAKPLNRLAAGLSPNLFFQYEW